MPTKRELYEENEALREIIDDVKTRLSDLESDDENDSENEDESEESENSEDEDWKRWAPAFLAGAFILTLTAFVSMANSSLPVSLFSSLKTQIWKFFKRLNIKGHYGNKNR